MVAYDEPQHDPVGPPPDVASLSREDAIMSIKGWFLQNFDDPVHDTPYVSAEGGYQYIWGGPYEVRDILETFFSDVVPEELIRAAAEELENESLEWVPSSGRRQPPEDWVNHSIPEDPHSIYLDSYHQVGDLLAKESNDDGGHLINRLIFAHHITALEAYLSDTLLRAVMKDPDAMKRLVFGSKDLTSKKYSMVDVISSPNFVLERVSGYLRSILYHNLAKVDELYRLALKVQVLDEQVDREKLFRAIELRHDCVHRNGMDRDGHRSTVFTRAYVQDVADPMRALVNRLELKIHGEPPF
jgi:hypothetical protein